MKRPSAGNPRHFYPQRAPERLVHLQGTIAALCPVPLDLPAPVCGAVRAQLPPEAVGHEEYAPRVVHDIHAERDVYQKPVECVALPELLLHPVLVERHLDRDVELPLLERLEEEPNGSVTFARWRFLSSTNAVRYTTGTFIPPGSRSQPGSRPSARGA